jgi:hypothetical protein
VHYFPFHFDGKTFAIIYGSNITQWLAALLWGEDPMATAMRPSEYCHYFLNECVGSVVIVIK